LRLRHQLLDLMLIATWNVNSVKAHMDVVLAWLKEASPDVVCLQEIKCEDTAFPAMAFAAEGYQSVVHGQKTYNGVAILSKTAPDGIVRGLPGNGSDEQARYIEAAFTLGSGQVRIGNLYLPNGNPAPGPKYDYKLAWMHHLRARAASLLEQEETFILCGDYNVIPSEADARFPENWRKDALFLPETRTAFQSLLNLGLRDALRTLNPALKDHYTFWDYQAGSWQKNNGIRIDHHLLSPQAADRLVSARIDKHVRGWEKPSDHVPVVIELA
jgi:exodeoxyribonuclease-3